MNFVFLSPNFPSNYQYFVQGLKENGVCTLGIGDEPYNQLHHNLKAALVEYYQVSSLENNDEVYRAVAYFIHKYGRIDFLESNNEYWLERDAKLRSDYAIDGLNKDTIQGIRYKSKMKAYYQKAGCKVARYHVVSDYQKGLAFINEVGLPVIVKPDNGMGATSTYRINTMQEVKEFYNASQETQMIMEEYLEGTLLTYDGIADSKRRVIYESSFVFEVPVMELVNEGKDCYFYSVMNIEEDLKELGQKVVANFETQSRFFHCEYFRLTKAKEGLGEIGDLIGLEVNMRPPGGNAPDIMNFAQDINVYQIWANMIAFDEARYDVDKNRKYCIYVARRDQHTYKHSLSQIEKKYKSAIRMNQRGPEALSKAMGNHLILACFEDKEVMMSFKDFVLEHK